MSFVEDLKKAIDYAKSGEIHKSEQIYKSVLKSDKNNIVALTGLGILYLNTKNFKGALKYLKQAYMIKPSETVTESLGTAYYYLNKYSPACEYFSQIIDSVSTPQIYKQYVDSLLRLNKNSAAYEYAKLFYEKFPFNSDAIYAYAQACVNTGRVSDAQKYAQILIEQYPKIADGWSLMGLIKEVFYHDNDGAETCFKKALRYGNKYDAYFDLAVNSEKRGDYKKTFYYLNKLSKYVDKREHTISFIKASVYFKTRQFKKALKQYLYRGWSNGKYSHNLKNIWDGKPHKDRTLFVLGDYGYGDIIMYSRYIPFLENKFKKIKIYIREGIDNLIKRSISGCKNIEFVKKSKRYPYYDNSVTLSDLPYYLNMAYDNIPKSEKYLTASVDKVDKYKKYIKGNGLKIGLCWESGTVGLRDMLHRNLNISLLEPLFGIDNTEFYSLQVNPSMNIYKQYSHITDLGKTFSDFDDTAGAVSNLDLVITVDTSGAHLAGALGVKTFLILPYCSDWRWFDNDERTEWYDSVRIFKQKNPKTWNDVVENIKEELSKIIQ